MKIDSYFLCLYNGSPYFAICPVNSSPGYYDALNMQTGIFENIKESKISSNRAPIQLIPNNETCFFAIYNQYLGICFTGPMGGKLFLTLNPNGKPEKKFINVDDDDVHIINHRFYYFLNC